MLHRPESDAARSSNRVSDVGFDPVKWIGRLQDVNNASRFTEYQRKTIDLGFKWIIQELESEVAKFLLIKEDKHDTAASS